MRRVLGFFLLLLVVAPSSAAAHSNVVETNPADGATIDRLPAEATVTFNEAPTTANVVLEGPDGQVHKLVPRIAGSTVTVRLPSAGPRGAYTLSYRVVSADGHPISGSSDFTVTTGTAPSAGQPQSPPVTDDAAASAKPESGVLGAVVIGVALLGVAAAVVVARSVRR